MNRTQDELERLYGAEAPSGPGQATRALVLELALPATWTSLAAAWKGVQADLDLPAPAIAVSGSDGLQLWFSLAEPVLQARGERFLQGLRERYLADVPVAQVRLGAGTDRLPPRPPRAVAPDRWSAFVTPDLASVFAETPWLDIPPGDEGQSAILRALAPASPAAFEAALGQLAPAPSTATPSGPGDADPVRFLVRVMNDESAPLALRIEAAKALLPSA